MNHRSRRFFRKIAYGSVLFLTAFSSPALSQDSLPYLKSATLYLAVDGWADVWLNGIPIRESQPSTSESKGFRTIPCIPDHICYFQKANVLAIENANAYNSPAPLKAQIGVAYILRLWFSDGTELTLSSNDARDHKAYYLANREAGEPSGWQRTSFDDGGWPFPRAVGAALPGVAQLLDPETHQSIQFLSASGGSFKSQFEGEKHLYRREFSLNIRSNPLCSPVEVQAVRKPLRKVPAVIPTPTPIQVVWAVPTLAPPPVETPKPAFVWHPISTPTRAPIPMPPPTWTPILYPTAAPAIVPFQVAPSQPSLPTVLTPTLTVTGLPQLRKPTPAPTAALIPMPPSTWTPAPCPTAAPAIVPFQIAPSQPSLPMILTPTLKVSRRPQWRKPTATPSPDFAGPSRVEPLEAVAPAAPVWTETSVPTSMPTPEPTLSQAQTIVFESQPANIYISFADGPGVYRLEVVDSSFRHVRALFEKRIVAQQDDWVEWDGKDDAGKDMPPGLYTVLYTKDDRQLNKLVLVKEAE